MRREVSLSEAKPKVPNFDSSILRFFDPDYHRIESTQTIYKVKQLFKPKRPASFAIGEHLLKAIP